MKININNKDFEYEVCTFLKVYYPNENIELVEQDMDYKFNIKDDYIGLAYYEDGHKISESYYDKKDKEILNLPKEKKEKRKEQKRLIKRLMYELINDITSKEQPWGILTGIRPTKVVFNLIDKYDSNYNLIRKELKEDYKISKNKIDLLIDIVNKEYPILQKNKENEISIYIGIPFCPTRCLYCSFTSYPIDVYKNRVDAYLDALNKEISFVSQNIKDRPIRTIYIGGGTPTSLDNERLKKLMYIVNENFDINKIEEFTVEAGRPDTLNRDKLLTLKTSGVDRISINPQTMNQKTLDIIGRRHTVKQIINSYSEAREIGFNSLNMDLILGLPEETPPDVENTMKEIIKLNPNNLTVHTMAIKRASKLNENIDEYNLTREEEIREMINISANGAKEIDLEPYYMYRQKNMLGNFENVGYAKKGKECIYNIEIMEEQQTIYAIGAGASTKIVYPSENRIERVENVKNVEQYIERIGEMIERKKKYLEY